MPLDKKTKQGDKCNSLAAWDMVCQPKQSGGLGIINLRIQSEALLLKYLHKFYNHHDLPWVDLIWTTYYTHNIPHASEPCGSFWWKDILNLAPAYRAVTSVELGDGGSTLFSKDAWREDILANSHPRLFSFAKHEDISVKFLLTSSTLGQNFHLPLSMQAREELDDLQTSLASVEPTEVNDAWRLIWGAEELASSKYYLHCFRDMEADDAFTWIWKSKCTNKWKFFAWLLFTDRLNTRNMLRRRHYKLEGDVYTCLLCYSPPQEETVVHLFFRCPFATRCWDVIGMQWHDSNCRLDLIHGGKRNRGKRLFMEPFIIAAWGCGRRGIISTLEM